MDALPRSFDEFYRDEVDRLRRALAVHLGDADLAADSVDEAMARALERWTLVAAYDNPAGWVYRVARNHATSRLRRTARRVLRAEVPDRAEWLREQDLELADALASLSEAHRSVVVLRFQLDWQVDQIASALDVPPGTIKSRLSRAVGELRTLLAAQGRTGP
jgi:RNA polymerase sigma-70 factor (ECF subfamily)